jgi:hypothetical protein
MKRLRILVPFLLLAVVMSGCIFGNDDDDDGGNDPGWQVYGYVNTTRGAPLKDVTLTLTKAGKTVKTATSGSYGYYVFNDVPNGTYTVVPSKYGYTFTPSEVRNVYVRNEGAVVDTFVGAYN